MTVRRAFKSKNKNKRKPFDISIEGETFTCRGGISGGLLLKVIGAFSTISDAEVDEETGEESVDFKSMTKMDDLMRDFFSLAIIRSDQERFFEFLDNPDNEIELETLMEVMQWLIGVYSDRPLATSEDSTESS